jgi:hypothetical protein
VSVPLLGHAAHDVRAPRGASLLAVRGGVATYRVGSGDWQFSE